MGKTGGKTRGQAIASRVRGKNKGKPIPRDPIYYGHLIEYGTSRSRATPVLRPAWQNNKSTAEANVAQVLRDGIAEAAKG
jgi:hypothetical protein